MNYFKPSISVISTGIITLPHILALVGSWCDFQSEMGLKVELHTPHTAF